MGGHDYVFARAAVTPTVWQRLDQTARSLVPALTVLLFVILSVIPVGLPGWGELTPPLSLVAVFYWSIHRPSAVPPSVAFAIGLFQDLVSAGPLGASSLILVTLQWVVSGQRRFLITQPFLVVWGAFAMVAGAAALAEWLAYALLTFALPPIQAGMLRAALGIALFPIVARLVLLPAQRLVAGQEA